MTILSSVPNDIENKCFICGDVDNSPLCDCLHPHKFVYLWILMKFLEIR